MKKIITSAVCTSLLFIAGCNETTETKAAVEAPVMQKTALESGID
jgi:endothelin-converting enzyme/putative endopeptidase